jgi:quinol monooxygenase YgiN
MAARYGLHGYLLAKEGQGTALSEILLKAADLMAKSDDCQLYLVSQEKSEPNKVWITEAWTSEQAHDNSLNLPGVKELISQAMPLLAEPPKGGQKLRILGGHGL